MGHAIAQQVLEGGCHAVQHATVHFNGAAGDVQLDLFAGFLGGLAHHGVQAFGNAFELHHAGAQQVALQLTRLAALGDQVVFGAFHGALQIALHRGHVVDRLGHHAGQLLHPGEAVELQRIEACRRVLGQRQARLHLRLGLHLDVAQLLAQAVQVARQIGERAAELAQARVEARTADHHLARLVDQAVQQLRTHAHRLVGRHPQGRQLRGSGQAHGRGRHRHRLGRRCSRRRGGGLHHIRHAGAGGRHGFHRQGHHAVRGSLANGAQRLEVGLQTVETALQRLDLVGCDGFRVQLLDRRFQSVGHFAQAHRTGQSRTALERVQGPQHFAASAEVVGARGPLAQRTTQLRQQLGRLFLEDGEQVGVDDVDRIDVVVRVRDRGNGVRNGIVNELIVVVDDRRQRGGHMAHGRCGHGLGYGWCSCLWSGIRDGRLRHRLWCQSDSGSFGGFLLCCVEVGLRILFGRRLGADHLGFQNLAQLGQHFRAGLFEEPGSKLVQQATDVFRRCHEGGRLFLGAPRLQLHMLQRVLQHAGHFGQRGEAYRGRTAGQRVRQGHGRVRQRLVQLQRPFLQAGHQATRPFIGLIQVHVVQRDADAQRIDHLDGIVASAFFLRQGIEQIRHVLRGFRLSEVVWQGFGTCLGHILGGRCLHCSSFGRLGLQQLLQLGHIQRFQPVRRNAGLRDHPGFRFGRVEHLVFR